MILDNNRPAGKNLMSEQTPSDGKKQHGWSKKNINWCKLTNNLEEESGKEVSPDSCPIYYHYY